MCHNVPMPAEERVLVTSKRLRVASSLPLRHMPVALHGQWHCTPIEGTSQKNCVITILVN